MINKILLSHQSELLENLKPVFLEHKKALYGILPTPFALWRASKEYLALSDEELNHDSLMLRQGVDLSMNRSFCVEMAWMTGNLETYFMLLATLELDRRQHPEDPSKEILFCNYAPKAEDEVQDGWYDREKVAQEYQRIKDRAAA